MVDFIKFEWSKKAEDVIFSPALIIPSKRGKLYRIQYGGCGCFHCTIRGIGWTLPPMKFGKEEGTIFNPDFWYAHSLSIKFDHHATKNRGALRNARSFLYDLIDEEIEDRCTKLGPLFRRKWITAPYTHIRVVREYDKNNEAMMLVRMKEADKEIFGVLTWTNCD